MARGLGKGLSSLIPQEAKAPVITSNITTLKTSEMIPGEFQPRQFFDKEELKELAESIAKNGIFQPILVRKIDAKTPYEIIAGERRWRAAQIAGLKAVPVIIRELEDHQALEIAIIENVQRQDLKILEISVGYQRLMDEFNYTQGALAEVIGKSRSAIANTLRLQTLSDEVKKFINDGKLSAGHARALVASDNAEEIAKKVVNKGLNVRQTEELVKKQEGGVANTNKKAAKKTISDPELGFLQEEISKAIGYEVEIVNTKNGGKVILSYDDLDGLEKLLARLHRI